MKHEFFLKILLKPSLTVVIFSLWPLLSQLFPAAYLVPYLGLLYFIHAALILYFVVKYVQYNQYSKFASYKEAKEYHYDLRRVRREEWKARKFAIQKKKKDIETKKRLEEEKARDAITAKLKIDLENRKKKVL
jgi:hypothetical protein